MNGFSNENRNCLKQTLLNNGIIILWDNSHKSTNCYLDGVIEQEGKQYGIELELRYYEDSESIYMTRLRITPADVWTNGNLGINLNSQVKVDKHVYLLILYRVYVATSQFANLYNRTARIASWLGKPIIVSEKLREEISVGTEKEEIKKILQEIIEVFKNKGERMVLQQLMYKHTMGINNYIIQQKYNYNIGTNIYTHMQDIDQLLKYTREKLTMINTIIGPNGQINISKMMENIPFSNILNIATEVDLILNQGEENKYNFQHKMIRTMGLLMY
ncbi:MAG: hypothetical protein ACRCSG_04160 [Cellulosilyticaceae bacterium]